MFQTDQEAAAKRLDDETDARIKNLKESSSKVSKEIVKMLIKYVTTTGAWFSLHQPHNKILFWFFSSSFLVLDLYVHNTIEPTT